MECNSKKHFNTFDQLYEFHKRNLDKKIIITSIPNGGYYVEIENTDCLLIRKREREYRKSFEKMW